MMTEQDLERATLEIAELELRLRNAMLASSVHDLDRLLDDRLLFVGPDTKLYGKADDLALHRSHQSRFDKIDVLERRIEVHGMMAAVMVVAELAGQFRGEPFSSKSRYLRNWARVADVVTFPQKEILGPHEAGCHLVEWRVPTALRRRQSKREG